MTQMTAIEPRFAICITNTDYPAALEVRKIYQVLPDVDAAKHHLIRIVDESGEDYLYPAAYFVLIDLPQSITEALLKAA
jgi:hypothetical protein